MSQAECRRRVRYACLLLLWVAFPLSARGEGLVFVQGYLDKGQGWRESGIAQILRDAGWRDGGHLRLSPAGVYASRPEAVRGKLFYTLALPTEAPLGYQLPYLEGFMDFVRERHPRETLVLAGHSAGGVLARLYMVRHPEAGVDALITFASPHLGTGNAELGGMLGQSPLGWFAPFLGAQTLNRSQGLYHDLVRERPGTMLFWLNRQQHPQAWYVAVVREDDSLLGLGGDFVVADWSQDMNNVYALRGRVRTIRVPGGHGLAQSDGALLVRILSQLQRS